MLKSKTFNRICCAAFAAMLLITVVVWVDRVNAGRQTITMGYEGLFSRDRVHTINIEMNADEWAGFIRNAASEEYRECSVTIDGEKLSNVAIRAKGNTSLSSVSGTEAGKYSFKIEFDQYVSSRKYRGLDKLSLNNLIYDATMMKDYLAYTLMAKMEVPSPLCSFVWLTVNGKDYGLYLAVEGVEDSFLARNSMSTGKLYKPDTLSFGGGRGNGRDFDMDAFRTNEEHEVSGIGLPGQAIPPAASDDIFSASFGGRSPSDAENEGFGPSAGRQASGEDFAPSFGGPANPGGNAADHDQPPALPAGIPSDTGGFDFGRSNADVKLQYIDDNPESYSNIFDNAKTKITKKDQKRLIESLRKLTVKENLQDAVFADEVINYLAVHDFVQNGDSYTGSMVHNYYLYEENGHLAIIPWDYNLAFGTFSGGSNGKAAINSSIYTPVDGDVGDRPLVAWIFEDDEALKAYETAYSGFVTNYVFSGWGQNGTEPLSAEITRVADLIRDYVEKDSKGFYTAEDFDTAVDTMRQYCEQRGQSVKAQLEGKAASELSYGDGLKLSAMGGMSFGGSREGDTFFHFSGSDSPESRGDFSENPAAADPGMNIPPTSPGGPTGLQGAAGIVNISWGELGFYVLLLAAAILLIGLLPHHNR